MTDNGSRRHPAEDRTGLLPLKRKDPGLLRSATRAEAPEIWWITLSDLLMLLLVFFVILLGMELQKRAPNPAARVDSSENRTEKAIAIHPVPPPPEGAAAVEKELIAALNLENGPQEVMVKRASNMVTLIFPERIAFDPGRAQLKPSAQPTLDKVGNFIKERPALLVEVQGHTDDRPIHNPRYPSNWELSVDRATQVAKALIGLGVDPTRFSVKGFGEYRSLNPNDSDEHRFQNRRVEIQLTLPPPVDPGMSLI